MLHAEDCHSFPHRELTDLSEDKEHKHSQKERNVVAPGDSRESCGLTLDHVDHPKLPFWLSCLSHSDPATYSLARAESESLFFCRS